MSFSWIKDGFDTTNDTFIRHLSIGAPALASTRLHIERPHLAYTIPSTIKAHAAMTALGFVTLNLTNRMTMAFLPEKKLSFSEKEQEILKKYPLPLGIGLIASMLFANHMMKIQKQSKPNKEEKS